MVTARDYRGGLMTALMVLAGLACAGEAAPTNTPPAAEVATGRVTVGIPASAPPPAETQPTATEVTLPASPAFQLAVIVDTLSESVTRGQALALVSEASSFLQPHTSISLVMTDFLEDAGGGSTSDISSRYLASHAGSLPSGLLIFSFGDDGRAKLLGGYSFAIAGPAGFKNAFASPVTGSGQVYVAVVHSGHKYAACGYGGSDAVQSTTSLDGECRNAPGTPCVEHNGYSMCSDAVRHLYASTPTYFAASTIVHELLHPFAPGGDSDHYSTPECNSRMGYPLQFFDLQESQYYNGLCPHVYESFRQSYRP